MSFWINSNVEPLIGDRACSRGGAGGGCEVLKCDFTDLVVLRCSLEIRGVEVEAVSDPNLILVDND